MKIPPKLIICGREYRIIKDKKLRGGNFDGGAQVIRIGIKNNPPTDEIRITLLHEIIELILAERLLRYQKNYSHIENGHYLFCFNHQQFEDWIIDLNSALRTLIK